MHNAQEKTESTSDSEEVDMDIDTGTSSTPRGDCVDHHVEEADFEDYDSSDESTSSSLMDYSDNNDVVPYKLAQRTCDESNFLMIMGDINCPVSLNILYDQDESSSSPFPSPRQQHHRAAEWSNNWYRVYPPEPDVDVSTRFTVKKTGPRCKVLQDPFSYVMLFLTEPLWELMVTETNRHAHYNLEARLASGNLTQNSRIAKWTDVTVTEMKSFWAILINMGLYQRKDIEYYWRTDFMSYQGFYSKNMPLKRFQNILSMLSFSSLRGKQSDDPLVSLQEFIVLMNNNFKSYFVPKQEVRIDESVVYDERNIVFIKHKPDESESGIKKFEIRDSSTGYVLNVVFYSGEDFLSGSDDPFTKKVVAHLMKEVGLLGKGYHLFVNNYFPKIPLAHWLLTKNTFLTGMVHKNSKELSENIVQTRLEVGKSVYFRKKLDSNTSPDSILLLKHRKSKLRKSMNIVTTACTAEERRVKSHNYKKIKPLLFFKYSAHLDGLRARNNSVDQLICTICPVRSFCKKIVFNIMDMALQNAYILYKMQNSQAKSRHEFLMNAVQNLSAKKDNLQPLLVPDSKPDSSTHRLEKGTYSSMKVCVVCSEEGKMKQRTTWMCSGCKCGVHVQCYSRMRHGIRPMKEIRVQPKM
ncbi:hypothetical protein J6590_108688 [Homalodisca vitripennis]|nr:hypothetical protein J6590_108688 [Homalodisca vitripennis]